MNLRKKMLPIGVENFEKIRTEDFYYVDKTGLISDLLHNPGEVNLFTRPRRFGKSLNMSMLEKFFSPESDKSIFEGLHITEDTELCAEYMGRYPVISISLKGIDFGNYETAYEMAVLLVRETVKQHEQFLVSCPRLTDSDRLDLERLLDPGMSEAVFIQSLKTLAALLEKCFAQKVIVLIDEYDVPLAKAYEQGYYEQMTLLIRNLFHQTLKTNSSLKFAVLTGCMQISKESIFTGMNNLRVLSVTDADFDDYFGFTDHEVRELLAYYELDEFYGTIKDWYDGYRFGKKSVYCPWDVISYCDRLRSDRNRPPENFWINSSSNYAVRRFIEFSGNATIKGEIEELINGSTVEKAVKQELTYQDMYASVENLWSVLFTTGYLTQRERIDGNRFRLVIPNREVRSIFEEQIMELFKENVRRDEDRLHRFCRALRDGNASETEKIFGNYLRSTISIRDTAVRKPLKESFYHGILVGILSACDSWGVMSNRESGEGYADIIASTDQEDLAVLIEVKYAQSGDLDAACQSAMQQIREKHYTDSLFEDGYNRVLTYGIGCCRKRCRVMVKEETAD